ncbi:hypothetical protein EJ02DRAFT_477740 [Clathrospora elynae]|uniref:Tc1-like transposase DDE domain-containing protein n=1 Tax=Clathrospora elynae TaxID=706981 RepID=A0A6A5SB03_9PLEO|nr:hypothetical protein EJ02DRAFT_477740 [Clathrospora elynae]
MAPNPDVGFAVTREDIRSEMAPSPALVGNLVTVGDELDPTCIVEKLRRKRGWMFWGCFSGDQKGPCIFWEKEWGTINKESYCERIVPLVDGWMHMNPHLSFMQDGAPGHAAATTLADLYERGVTPIFWPALSPDLNPIEAVWNMSIGPGMEHGEMRVCIDYGNESSIYARNSVNRITERHYPDLEGGKQESSKRLREIVYTHSVAPRSYFCPTRTEAVYTSQHPHP